MRHSTYRILIVILTMSVLSNFLLGDMDMDTDMDMDKDMMTDASLSSDAFCTSGMHMHKSLLLAGQEGMIMYMDGFRFSLSGNSPCLNLYFPSWTLDTRGKFWWAMVGVVLLGIVTEGISKLRSLLVSFCASPNHSTPFRFLTCYPLKQSKKLTGSAKRWTITLLHGLQALVGYILMLATMTFSVELLACVIVGLGLGFALFYDDDDLHVTTNPVSYRMYASTISKELYTHSRTHTFISAVISFRRNSMNVHLE